MADFIGKSGRYYVKNPFDDGKGSFAVFASLESYNSPFNRGYLGHVPNDVAYADHLQDMGGYVFTVNLNGIKEKVKVDTNGMMENGEDFKEHLTSLMNKHGRENVNYSYERI